MLTLVTCFYILNSKFNLDIYKKWIDTFLSNVNNFNLVVFTNKRSLFIFDKYKNQKIKIIIKELNNFYNYKYKSYWIKNNELNHILKYIDWQLQMVWAEKIHFVKDAIENQYFESKWFGWCDIGYFRNGHNDEILLKNWITKQKINSLSIDKIYYAQVCSDNDFVLVKKKMLNRNNKNLPMVQLEPTAITIAGGFFLIHKKNIVHWFELFDNKLNDYFSNDYIVKDDQTIITNCICLNLNLFHLIKEDTNTNKWFAFKNFLK